VCASNECGSWWKLKYVCVQSSPPIKKPQAGLDFTALWGGIEKESGDESREMNITFAAVDGTTLA